ncbi:DUF6573 family protein [Pseudogulbenkiania subflava]|uniref:Uncharacterized protein n=1 Tax=Pseudogulbenkiania subflava DSM 22618 TaxID=1123014 RepID=A0A1Y6CET8_9NEIS|nr:DUF6573 family protein [Pseudogulbenkiania subflava]SMF52413.1 hypothetical protein SAMN02745746_03764 [Pseudogulbenkiania subflava DSM 22618]
MNDPIFGEPIYAYCRAQAIADGVLIDVTDAAREAGFRLPVAVTAGVWATCVAWEADEAGQDERGRLWDVLWLARLATRKAKDLGEVDYSLRVEQASGRVEHFTLRLAIGPGDDGEPVLTILYPGED